MNILYAAFARIPTEKAHGAQILKTCEAFSEAGATVELIVPGRKTHIKADLFEYYGAKKNFSIIMRKTPDLVFLGPLGFAFSLLWFSELVKWTKSFWNADVIYSRDATLLLQFILLGKKLVYEAHMKPTVISTFVARRAYRLVVISEGLRDVYQKRGVKGERIVVAHDAVDPEPFQRTYSQNEERARLGIPTDKKIALYVGRIDSAKGADTFAAASEFVDDDVRCVLIGTGPLADILKNRFPKALLLPPTPYGELARVLSVADVLVLPNSAKDKTYSTYTSPLKAFAYRASRIPIISSDVPALKSILKNNATYFSPDDPKELATVIKGEYVKNTGEVYTWRDRAEAILHSLDYV